MSDSRQVLKGAGPDAPRTTNSNGGSQSDIPYRFDLLDGPAIAAMAEVLADGAVRYGANNWRKICVDDHLNHAMMHILAFLSGDTQDDHLAHALCRSMFALGVELADRGADVL